MDTKTIINTLISQIPMLIMAINNGKDSQTLLLVFLMPCLIYILNNITVVWNYLQKEKIPQNYVSYRVGDTSDNRNSNYNVDFSEDLSIFLNKFYPNSIKDGCVTNYYKEINDSNVLFKYLRAIIQPATNYFCKFSFSDMAAGEYNIMTAIKKTGFIFPKSINHKKLLENPIYISLCTIEEQIMVQNYMEKKVDRINKKYVLIQAIDFKTAEDFIFVVVNYNLFRCHDISNFRLRKDLYFHSDKGSQIIESTVNVMKTYQNVFLSKKNNDTITHIINEYNKNKTNQLKNGIPNKLSFLFYGKPGCGKSSITYAIAHETKKHIVSINFQEFTNQSFIKMMASIENKVILFEDLDTYEFTHVREDLADADQKKELIRHKRIVIPQTMSESPESHYSKKLTLYTLLDVMDGYNYLNDCILIATSNCPQILDPALIRPGRIDHKIEFDLCDIYQFDKIFKYFTGQKYQTIDPSFIFQENLYSTSHLINTIIIPNCNYPKKILDLLKPN